MIRPGDVVECIDPGRYLDLQRGARYRVLGIYRTLGHTFLDVGADGRCPGFFSWRFRRVDDLPETDATDIPISPAAPVRQLVAA